MPITKFDYTKHIEIKKVKKLIQQFRTSICWDLDKQVDMLEEQLEELEIGQFSEVKK